MRSRVKLCFKLSCRFDAANTKLTEKEESFILIHSLREANLPKFLAEDVPLFESILADLFPGVKPPDPDHGILEVCLNYNVIYHLF